MEKGLTKDPRHAVWDLEAAVQARFFSSRDAMQSLSMEATRVRSERECRCDEDKTKPDSPRAIARSRREVEVCRVSQGDGTRREKRQDSWCFGGRHDARPPDTCCGCPVKNKTRGVATRECRYPPKKPPTCGTFLGDAQITRGMRGKANEGRPSGSLKKKSASLREGRRQSFRRRSASLISWVERAGHAAAAPTKASDSTLDL